MTPIEFLGVRTKEPLHPCAQVASRGFYYQMKMIAHQTIRVNLPPRAPARPGQELKEESSIGVPRKDRLAPITPTQHMIDGARILDP